jgi:hypothetical protein
MELTLCDKGYRTFEGNWKRKNNKHTFGSKIGLIRKKTLTLSPCEDIVNEI